MAKNLVNTAGQAVLTGAHALTIAHTDASPFYGDLSPYRIYIVLEADGWHVDYEVKDSRLKGGGPHYVIDVNTGIILSKRYEQ